VNSSTQQHQSTTFPSQIDVSTKHLRNAARMLKIN